jgi:hypothetical protein
VDTFGEHATQVVCLSGCSWASTSMLLGAGFWPSASDGQSSVEQLNKPTRLAGEQKGGRLDGRLDPTAAGYMFPEQSLLAHPTRGK